ncbi:hypothetical protein ES319_D01G172600v1 [Gossypium barbadense]|uniref:Uncharacterized protein n=1 Tax=Gossypium barbadense TaxID=3634 RepID=A0A5J5SV26_GOSBA|nr:hypothetical protein ES319_D01G172600v1 [Gossypium barbadense]KAB2045589.1 hypothetical protein ES319_D01G172600v1 [Gossypium barbadense]
MFVSIFLKQKKNCSFRVPPTLGCRRSLMPKLRFQLKWHQLGKFGEQAG